MTRDRSLLDVRLEHAPGEVPYELQDLSMVDGDVRVIFRNLEAEACGFIQAAHCVVGCVAWLTSMPVLGALEQKRGVAVVVQKEDFLRPDHDVGPGFYADLRRAYDSLPRLTRYWFPSPLNRMSWAGDPEIGVRCVGNSNRERRPAAPRMHNKFMVSCDLVDDDESALLVPRAVWTGSFNFTKNGGRSFENAVVIESPTIARAYLEEFAQIAALSEPLDWTSEWCAPEWRVGT